MKMGEFFGGIVFRVSEMLGSDPECGTVTFSDPGIGPVWFSSPSFGMEEIVPN